MVQCDMFSDTTILFDLDGTLVDTAPDLLCALNATLESITSKPTNINDLRVIAGNGARAMIIYGLAADGRVASEEELDRLVETFMDYYNAHIAQASEAFPGATTCLKYLRDQGARLAICTNKLEKSAINLLERLSLLDYFSLVAGGDSYAVRKPHPDHLLLSMRRLGGVPERTVMVGDSEPDVRAAHAAAIPVIGVTYGYTQIHMEQLEPNMIIDHLEQLPQALSHLLNETTTRS